MTALEKLRGEVETLKRSVGNAKWWGRLCRAEVIEVHVRHLDSALKAVEDEARWVPVEERLPEESEDDEGYPRLLVMDSNGHVAPAIFHAETQCFEVYRILGRENAHLRLIAGAYDFVTHWRPLPEGPGEQ